MAANGLMTPGSSVARSSSIFPIRAMPLQGP